MELQRKASTVGFDWNDPRAVLSKIREEADEIEAALDNGNAEELAEETGDLLFALVNLARHVGADPEARCAAPTPSSSAASPISSARSRRRAVRSKRQRSKRWTRCGTRRRVRPAGVRGAAQGPERPGAVPRGDRWAGGARAVCDLATSRDDEPRPAEAAVSAIVVPGPA